MSAQAHYNSLFYDAVREFGAVSENTMTGIVGFSAGGPVSMCRLGTGNTFVTCELSRTPEQNHSTEGMRFELLSRLPFSVADTQGFLTSLGALSMEATLGDGHTIDCRAVSPSLDIQEVFLKLHSSREIDGESFGIYEVCRASAA